MTYKLLSKIHVTFQSLTQRQTNMIKLIIDNEVVIRQY